MVLLDISAGGLEIGHRKILQEKSVLQSALWKRISNDDILLCFCFELKLMYKVC